MNLACKRLFLQPQAFFSINYVIFTDIALTGGNVIPLQSAPKSLLSSFQVALCFDVLIVLCILLGKHLRVESNLLVTLLREHIVCFSLQKEAIETFPFLSVASLTLQWDYTFCYIRSVYMYKVSG